MKIKLLLKLSIVLLSIVILGLTSYIIYDNITNKKEKNNNQWMEYILNSDINEITLNRTRIAMTENEEDISKSIVLSTEELQEIFTKLSESDLIKKYSLGMGITDGDRLSISYSIDNVEYTIEIVNGFLFIEQIKDINLLNLIEKEEYSIENEELSNEEGSFYVYRIDYDNSVYDIYFK